MKKKLFLVLCSCFAGALALSSCGGGGGMDPNLTPSELLRYFANGNFEIVFHGDNTVVVTGQGSYSLAINEPQTVEMQGVSVLCKSKDATADATADFTINLDADGVPMSMLIAFSDLSTAQGEDETDLLPVSDQVKATMTPRNAAHPFQVNTTGSTDFNNGNTGITYSILYAGRQQL